MSTKTLTRKRVGLHCNRTISLARPTNDKDLACRVTRHIQTVFAIPSQVRRAETAIGTSAIVGVDHNVRSISFAGAGLDGLAGLEFPRMQNQL
jgi:hypothetical protein